MDAMQASVLRYHTISILIHWAVALLIFVDFGLGLTVDSFPKSWTGAIINAHALAGLAVLLLTFIRIWWRLAYKAPAYPADFGPLLRRMSQLMQITLYVMMAIVPIIGIPTLLYRGRGLDFGFFTIPSPFARAPEIFRPLTEVHELAAYALVGLALGHIAAAVYHQYVRRDRIMQRMTFA